MIQWLFKMIGIPLAPIIAAVQPVLIGFIYILDLVYNVGDVIILSTDKFLLNLLPKFPPFESIRNWGESQLIKILDKRLTKLQKIRKTILK